MNIERISVAKKELKHSFTEYTILHSDQIIRYGIERVIEASSLKYSENFAKDYIDAISKGYFPILISNHQSHFDAMAISKVTRGLTISANMILKGDEHNKGFLMPIAMSVGSGHQNTYLKMLYGIGKPILNNNHVLPVDLSREKDRINYNLPLNRKDFTKEMLCKLKEGYGGILVFPEGTMEAGRKDQNGKLKGMQFFAEGSIATYTNFARHTGKKAMYIPVGIEGTINIVSPDKFRIPITTIATGLFSFDPNLASINVGEIIREDDQDIKNLTNGQKDQYLGRKIAFLLPEYLRGVYA